MPSSNILTDVLTLTVIAPNIHGSILPCFQPSSFLTAGEVNEKRELSPVAMIPAVVAVTHCNPEVQMLLRRLRGGK